MTAGTPGEFERKTAWVVGVSFVTMVVEITAGYVTGSVALIADGWHMASHVGALLLSLVAHRYVRVSRSNPRFAFGPGKIPALAGYTNALLLGLMALGVLWEAGERLIHPVAISYGEALVVACLGLVVNLVSAGLLHHGHDHGDLNLKSAYAHVLADALTSVAAIVALLAGSTWGLTWLDPVLGILGAVIILQWAWGLVKASSGCLLDITPEELQPDKVRYFVQRIFSLEVEDVRIWALGPRETACLLTLSQLAPSTRNEIRDRLTGEFGFTHLFIQTRASD